MSKLVKCGCGGEAKVVFPFGNTDMYLIECDECGICTSSYNTEAEAVEAWNRAMGVGKNKIAITKGYWVATYDGLHCSVCNYKCETTALPNVCPHCGARLE